MFHVDLTVTYDPVSVGAGAGAAVVKVAVDHSLHSKLQAWTCQEYVVLEDNSPPGTVQLVPSTVAPVT